MISLFEQLKFDAELDEAFIEESSLSKLLGKQKGGQNLVKWLHRRHKLGNEADFEPAPFNKNVLWSQFKSNPDNFVIVSAEHGVAGIKPDDGFIRARTADYASRGRTYNPSTDGTLPYEIIAFTDDGEQVDPALLKPAGQSDDAKSPSVMKARMGKHSGRDTQNPDNAFNLLANQIGHLKTVWLSGFTGYRGDPEDSYGPATGSLERGKMDTRAGYKKPIKIDVDQAIDTVYNKVNPVLKTLASQALSKAGPESKEHIQSLIADLDSGTPSPKVKAAVQKALERAVGIPARATKSGDSGFGDAVQELLSSGNDGLRKILDSLRSTLIGTT